MKSDIQMQALLDQLNALDKEIERGRPTQSLWTALASGALAVFAVGAGVVGAMEWVFVAGIVLISALMCVPWTRVRRLERQRDRLLDTLDRPPLPPGPASRLPEGS